MPQLTVSMPSSIVYVAGYVNDAVTVFTQSEYNTSLWVANAEAAEDGLYHIALEVYDGAGNKSTYQETIEYIMPVFIYDRTLEDAEYAQRLHSMGWNHLNSGQREEWLSGLKGCLNKSDLKRMENNIKVISQLLKISLQTNESNIPDIPRMLYFKKLLDNVGILRSSGLIYGTTPEVPEHPLNAYWKINDIEHILHDIYEMYISNKARFAYCGENYAGEAIDIL